MTITDGSPTSTSLPTSDDVVILVDDDNNELGTADRHAVHTDSTPLHRAFSSYLFNDAGQVLITRRALSKLTWPGVWTNSCCGHPRPGETTQEAVARRVADELGAGVADLRPVLPQFRYRAVDASGVVENEICPVFVGRVVGEVRPDPNEVAEHAWVEWDELASAAAATPAVYSPWSVLQLTQMQATTSNPWQQTQTASVGSEDASTAASSSDVSQTLNRVDDLLRAEALTVERLWQQHSPLGAPDVLEDDPGDLPTWLHTLRQGGGKRIRPQMCHWGHVAAGGLSGTPSHDLVVTAAAALETLHLFALIHDDIMDRSLTRRGRPSAHVVAADRHRSHGHTGDPDRFGDNIAILLGDLAHAEANRLSNSLPPKLREFWFDLELELLAGQRADLTGAAAGRTDLAHAEAVAALKSGAYTIERPLLLGALAADASPEQCDHLSRFGRHLGQAFAWRDDVLGVWGDNSRTGKPVGDDLLQGKTTLIWVLGAQRLTGDAAAALERVATPHREPGDVALLQQALTEVGVRDQIEGLIGEQLAASDAALEGAPLTEAGVAGLRAAARDIAWRDA